MANAPTPAARAYLAQYPQGGTHPHQVARLAVRLCIALNGLGRFVISTRDMELLECAALLHDIGYAVSAKGHHKHGFKMIQAMDFPGVTPLEKTLIALVARYHRKAIPSLTHEPFACLSPGDQARVTQLAGVLRVADGLDRSHSGQIHDLHLTEGPLGFKLTVVGDKAAMSSERAGFMKKKGLLEIALGRSIRLALATLLAFFCCAVSLQAAPQPYVNFQTLQLRAKGLFENFYYFDRGSEGGNTLLVLVDGRGNHSALGRRVNGKWLSLGLSSVFNRELDSGVDLLIVERVGLDVGETYGSASQLSSDSFRNKTKLSALGLDYFLSLYPDYRYVVLVGYSEGGVLIPRIYETMEVKSKVTGMVLMASGGLSYYENLHIQKAAKGMHFSTIYQRNLDNLDQEVATLRENPFSEEDYFFGWPYARWAYFLSYRPVDDLVTFPGRVLILHGGQDRNIPIESAQAIVAAFEAVGKSNFTFREYRNSDHTFGGAFSTVVHGINAWMKSTDG